MTTKAIAISSRAVKYIGASTDTKPTITSHTGLPEPTVGSTFLEYDTGDFYVTRDGTNWNVYDDAHSTETAIETSIDAIEADIAEIRNGEPPLFGEPTLASANNASANWCRGAVSPLDQKSPTGWLACLYGGSQTGDDWARVNIPVNELALTSLTSAMWSYYMTNAETMGVNMVLWVHDPTDFDKRAEITQLANIATLEKASGWNAHELVLTTDQFFFYGENTTGTDLTAGPPNYYGIDDFQADTLFSTWTIYRITLEYGWDASGTFEEAWVADIDINGQTIFLKPDSGGSGRIAHRLYTVADTLAFTLAPKTPWRLLSINIHASATLDTGEAFTATLDAGAGAAYDTVIYSDDLFIGSRTSQLTYFGEGYDFCAEDEMDFVQANTSDDTIGVNVTYQTVFS